MLGSEQNCAVYPSFCICFLSVLLLLFFSSFAVPLNGLYPKPRVLPFASDSSPHSTGGGEERANGRMVLCSQLGLNHDTGLLFECTRNCRLVLDILEGLDATVWMLRNKTKLLF